MLQNGDVIWNHEVRPEWASHSWRSFEEFGAPTLVREARVWAEDPNGVLYVHSTSPLRAYGVAVALSQRAVQAICADEIPAERPFAVGCLDELSVPEDPDPDYTAEVRATQPTFSSVDTREHHLALYVDRLAASSLTLLRLPADPDLDADIAAVLDRVADHRHNHMLPTLLAGVIPPDLMAAAYGPRIGWRLGFAHPEGTQIGVSTPDAAVLDVDHPPGV